MYIYIYIYIYMFYSNTITKSITNDNNHILIIMKTYLIRYACLTYDILLKYKYSSKYKNIYG